ncbi:hypothetical protein GCM10007874_31880 [Labrys miyagiensis]|uniref:Uncharacterized protein n=1 Tax=Labrys miyagiensis TaxID=346912 RepID=A0ABQ6CII2_9HYPH|nr:hypothetical protein [Labrys miyagiensis]GLS20171.1 hypothetical protein GCM10007874_31880 [Labrys miyagiensis]
MMGLWNELYQLSIAPLPTGVFVFFALTTLVEQVRINRLEKVRDDLGRRLYELEEKLGIDRR